MGRSRKDLPPDAQGVPTPVHDGPTLAYGDDQEPYEPIILHDERAFMEECADRLNAFLVTYPREAQQVLATFVSYEHELVSVHEQLNRHKPYGARPPGAHVAALFGAVLQTHQGNGFFLRPLILPDPDSGPGCSRIVKFVVVEQEDEGDGPSS